MKILGVSTSTKQGSLCLFDGKIPVAERSWHRDKSHGEIIHPYLEEALDECSWQLSDLQGIAVDPGPGSFTGIRVGINLAKSLAYGQKLPLVSKNSLLLIAETQENRSEQIQCLLPAFKNEYYFACYQKDANQWSELVAPQCLGEADLLSKLSNGILAGDIPEPLRIQLLSSHPDLEVVPTWPTAKNLCRLSAEDFNNSKTIDWKNLTSLYLKDSSAEEKKRKGLLKPLPKL